MATIKDIAVKVGVSNAAVSRVLNYDDGISVNEDTRKAIFRAAEELNYKKKKIYPKIENVKILNWISDKEELEDAYYKTLCEEMEEKARKRNIQIERIDKVQGISAVSEDTRAFIAIGRFTRAEVNYLKAITKHGIFVDSSPDESTYDSVRPNHDSIVTQITDYFIQKGHTNLGFMGLSDFDIDTNEPLEDIRLWSFRQTADYFHLYNKKNIFIADSLTVNSGYKLGLQIIEKMGDNIPTAFCVANDTLAIGFLQALNEKGLEIPRRVAVFSINNINVAQYVSPPLSTFHIDIPTMCDTALNLLYERIISKRDVTKSIYINGKPIFRKSC